MYVENIHHINFSIWECRINYVLDWDLRKASVFVITTERLGFVLTKQAGDFLMRV